MQERIMQKEKKVAKEDNEEKEEPARRNRKRKDDEDNDDKKFEKEFEIHFDQNLLKKIAVGGVGAYLLYNILDVDIHNGHETSFQQFASELLPSGNVEK
ncbi:hypothetical protein O9G_005460 [Rozella allomycis CSF55]|uniref:Uncharacterized protein n=1 Tax=Rozella allomycis (strain CSF55) TaxID=988480 RepID=A0A075AML2_ROZAC|nr:hypothetical protein O9G_005460 [Rozella allomycis CSF55]|eukprot:EPZ30858.1 hypothetical protein O9G_005460 [Rozella allomycis CSF55]